MLTNILILAQTADYGVQVTGTGGANETTLLGLFMKGGPILIPIVILSIFAFYLILKKSLDIRDNLRIDPGFTEHLNGLLKKGDMNAVKTHLQNDTSAYARIFHHVMNKVGKPKKEIEETLESVSNIEVSKVSKNLGYLGLIAGIAPMLGFVGTILGVIKIFYNISLTDNISIGIISGGLYEKMISSCTGLVVGIIAFTGYHLLNMRIDRFIAQIEEEAFQFLNIVNG